MAGGHTGFFSGSQDEILYGMYFRKPFYLSILRYRLKAYSNPWVYHKKMKLLRIYANSDGIF